jgi:hypothetical protein
MQPSVTRPLVGSTQYNQSDGVGAVSQTLFNHPSTTEFPVVSGPNGLHYDVDKVADEWQRNRILANRASAKISRKRRLDETRAMNDEIARLEDENNTLREANVDLELRIKEAPAGNIEGSEMGRAVGR